MFRRATATRDDELLLEQRRGLEEQKRFFERWIWPVVEPLCDAIDRDPNIVFYKHVGQFAKAFFHLEQSAFEML